MQSFFPSPIKERAKKYAGIYLAIILFIVSFGLGILTGQTWLIKKQLASTSTPEVTNVINLDRVFSRSKNVNFNQFWEVWDKIKEKYVKQPVKDSDMFYGAIQGLTYSLGDPYSVYFPPKAAAEFSKDLSGELEGIGAEIGIKNDQLVVVAPLPASPAEKAGLRPGDKILAIDKINTFGMDVNTAVSKIRGKADTQVTLFISRDGLAKGKDIIITRAKINVPAVMYSVKPGNIAYLRIMQFNDETMPQFDKYVKKLTNDGVKGIILDLRSNPGGYLDSAIDMASAWVEKGVVVSEKGNGGYSKEHNTQGSHPLANLKTMVLVNGGSASASEIVAGALQDYKKATVIGEKTFGKGSVQDFETFSDGSALKLTVAEWFTPNGRNINQQGIMPDIEVKEEFEKEKIGEDVMINKALELLK
ncbi:MAG: S41 family peptidase [Patescibacteria group bacterium]